MKTWLSNYSLPQFIAIVGILFYVIPGLIFIAWAWGKYKCPKCDALAKNTPASANAQQQTVTREERECPWCAETILAAAKICKHCGKEVPPLPSSNKGVGTDVERMKEYGITFDGERYAYGNYKYDKLSDAVSYAKVNSGEFGASGERRN
jgi:DNA-directed RNA polymerase subunit RPC12/RpoP